MWEIINPHSEVISKLAGSACRLFSTLASLRAVPQNASKLAGLRNTRVWFASRNLHADALEWLWFVNSHSEVIYKLMYGDKDTFRLAFALAGKSDFYEQVPHIFHHLLALPNTPQM